MKDIDTVCVRVQKDWEGSCAFGPLCLSLQWMIYKVYIYPFSMILSGDTFVGSVFRLTLSFLFFFFSKSTRITEKLFHLSFVWFCQCSSDLFPFPSLFFFYCLLLYLFFSPHSSGLHFQPLHLYIPAQKFLSLALFLFHFLSSSIYLSCISSLLISMLLNYTNCKDLSASLCDGYIQPFYLSCSY